LLGYAAFRNCTALKNIELPYAAIFDSYPDTFEGCTGLQSLALGKGLSSIDEYAFQSCESLETVLIPSGVAKIGRSTFDGCRGMIKVVIPESVTAIEAYAFANCTGMTKIVYEGTVSRWHTVSKSGSWFYHDSMQTVTCTDGDVSIYEY
jgi:hypothetical protein